MKRIVGNWGIVDSTSIFVGSLKHFVDTQPKFVGIIQKVVDSPKSFVDNFSIVANVSCIVDSTKKLSLVRSLE